MQDKPRSYGKTVVQKMGIVSGPSIFLLSLYISAASSEKHLAGNMAAVAVFMAIWWITEAVPISVTALLPVVLYPLLGIMTGNATAHLYMNSTIFLFMGGFMIALTMEKWGLHKRIAFTIIRIIGGGSSRIILGFMTAAAFLSMWISNTATAILMVPIGLAVIFQMEKRFGVEKSRKFSVGLMLGIAYACSVGGIATLVGTPPNLSFARIFTIIFPKAEPIGFGQWMVMALPITLIMLGLLWILITKIFFRVGADLIPDRSLIDEEYHKLGKMIYEEKIVLILFLTTAFLWVFRKKIVLGVLTIPGWSQFLPYSKMIDDGTVALFISLILFLIPAKNGDSKTLTVMGPDVFKNIPWDIVLLFGGGFALAAGFKVTGLSEIIGSQFKGLSDTPPFIIVNILCLTLTFLTELTSNTATTEMILPILASVAVAIKTNPLLLMIPATISASCAFMMPVATPPNAIIFGSGRVRIIDMIKIGFVANIASVIIITVIFYFFGKVVFLIDPAVLPAWGK